MHRKLINEKDFLTDIVFHYTIAVCQSLLWLPEEKPQLVLCFTIYRKVVSVNRCRLNDDTLLPKIINIGLDLLELFEHITGVRNFLRHSVERVYNCAIMLAISHMCQNSHYLATQQLC